MHALRPLSVVLLLALLAFPQSAVAGPYLGACPTLDGFAARVPTPAIYTSVSDFMTKNSPHPATLEWLSGGALCTGGAAVTLQLDVPNLSISATIPLVESTVVGPIYSTVCSGQVHQQLAYAGAGFPSSRLGAAVNEGLCAPPPSAAANAWGHYYDALNGQWYDLWFADQTP